MDKVFIKDLVARGIIGLNEWEREKLQEILINVVMFTDTSNSGLSDSLVEGVNYKVVAKKLLKHAESAKRFTVEALATDFAKICLEEEFVERVIVRLEKPHAVRFSASVGVEIERTKEDFL